MKLRKVFAKLTGINFKKVYSQIKWIYGYGKHYWLAMVLYTVLGMVGAVVGLVASIASKELIDIITCQESGDLVQTFAIMIGLNIGVTFINQASSFAANWVSMKVDAEIKSNIFAKILATDWESLTTYHTGDLLTRWGRDVTNLSNGILNFIPNAII